MSPVRFRPYTPEDRGACLAVVHTAVPDFVHPTEVHGYAAWLDVACAPGAADPCAYVVGELEGEVVCAGGVSFANTAPIATLCWGLVRRDLHRSGIGSALLRLRLDVVRARGGVERVCLDTSPAAVGFFLRHGFVVTARVKDGYAPGVDRLDLERVIA